MKIKPSKTGHASDAAGTDTAAPELPATEAAKARNPWGPIAAFIWAVLVYLSQFAAGSPLTIYPALRHWNQAQTDSWLNNSIAAQFVGTVLIEAAAVGIVALLLRHYRAAWRVIGLLRPRIKDVLYALVGFGVYFVTYIVLISVATRLVPSLNVNQQQDVGFQHVSGVVALMMAFISLVVLPPIAEEIIFRGFVFTGFRRTFGFVLAALATSILFAIPHLLESDGGGLLWIGGIDTFILSCVLCFLREKTGRLVPGMGVHALKNAVAFTTLFIFHVH